MPGITDVPSIARSVKEFAESIGITISGTGFAFLILVCGGLYVFYYTYDRAVQPLGEIAETVASLKADLEKQQALLTESRENQTALGTELRQSMRESEQAFDKLTDRLEEIEDGYWVSPSVSASEDHTLISSITLPFKRNDDVFMRLFLPRELRRLGDGSRIEGISLLINGVPVPVDAYIARFPQPLPKDALDPSGGFQEFELAFDTTYIKDPDLVDDVGMLFVVRRTMILAPATDDDLASFAD